MTKWNLPEGRKPLTDEDMAALTRRLADTAIEHSELYQAAKRDAEEAEAYAAELEAKLAEVERERDDARKLQAKDFELLDSPWKRRAEKAAAALAEARREALEEAAKVAEYYDENVSMGAPKAIRALAAQEGQE